MRLGAFASCIVVLMAVLPASAAANYDVFDSELITEPNAFGQEVAYAGGATVTYTKDVGSTAAFGLDPGEGNSSPPNFNGCAADPAVFAGRTAWARFDPAVNGEIEVEADTPTYDSIVWIREAAQRPWKSTSFSNLVGNYQNCEDTVKGPGSEKTFALDARGDRVYYVQVGGKCPGGPDTCGDPAVPGGETRLSLTFKPDDSDADGVPDTAPDNCPGTPAGTQVTTDGCPDEDGDNVQDKDDDCKGLKGDTAPSPFDGCPPGPNPPEPGEPPSVRIVSTHRDFVTTASPVVHLLLNWPKGAQTAYADNKAGDDPMKIALKPEVEWTLSPAKNGRGGGRTVEVRFSGPKIPDVTPFDDIQLDPEPPTVPKSVFIRSGRHRWTAVVRARDNDGGSGVRSIAPLDARAESIRTVDVCGAGGSCRQTEQRTLSGLDARPRSVRVLDDAGNKVEVPMSTKHCGGGEIRVFSSEGNIGCVRLRQKCKPTQYQWAGAYPSLKCEPLDGVNPPRVQRLRPKH